MNTAPPAAPSPDAGAQAQRTALAWSRTGLAVSVNAVLVLRLGEESGRPLTTALGIFLLLAAAGVIGVAGWRRRVLERSPSPPGPPARMVLAIVLLVWVACMAEVGFLLATTFS